MLRIVAAIWGFTGVVLFIGYAVYRLSSYSLDVLDYPLLPWQWLLLLANVFFMAYSEGYKGFQKSFSPRVAARVLYLSQHAKGLQIVFAPAFCLGYFGTTRRRQISACLLTVLLVGVIMLVKSLEQPWRGIIDAGVVVGLSWGLISFVFFVIQAFSQEDFPHSAEVSN